MTEHEKEREEKEKDFDSGTEVSNATYTKYKTEEEDNIEDSEEEDNGSDTEEDEVERTNARQESTRYKINQTERSKEFKPFDEVNEINTDSRTSSGIKNLSQIELEG